MLPDPAPDRQRADQSAPLDSVSELLDPHGDRAIPVQMHPADERVMFSESAGQRLDEFGNMIAHGIFGQFDQAVGVTISGDGRIEHGP